MMLRTVTLSLLALLSANLPARAEDPDAYPTHKLRMLLPYAAESFPLRIRGRTTGTVAACTKAGGMLAQFLAILALVPALDVVSLIIIVPTIGALVLVAMFGKETRGRDLRDLDPDGRAFAATGI